MVKRINTQRKIFPLVNCFSDSVASCSFPRRSYLTVALLTILLLSGNAVLAQDGPDNDADGIANTSDLDDDNDGILDVNEGLVDANSDGVPDADSADTDGDGTPDALDLDSDNDGVLDNLETQTDRAAVDAFDLNPNGAIDISFEVGANGIADAIETSVDSGVLIFNLLDSDSDGIPDFRDNDSDNDGIFDLVEAGGVDADGNGLIDSFSDSDGKGVDDVVQGSALPVFDTDGDGTLDFRDVDSDGDGIPDLVESGGSSIEGPVDTDADGAADYRETDSDNDGVSDDVEAGSNPLQPTDSNGDGRPDFQDGSVQNGGNGGDTDADSNTGGDTEGQSNDDAGATDSATDGATESNDASGANDAGSTDDSDTSDSNNDGASNGGDAAASDDAGATDDSDAVDAAADGGSSTDGSNDAVVQDDEVIVGPDIDGDGIPNQIDIDDDNDGIPDELEDLFDDDKDGIADEDSRDTDGDGTPDGLDLDSDNDGILDNREGHPDAEIVSELDQAVNGAVDIGLEVGDNGLADVLETSPDSGQINFPLQDIDADGIPDLLDLDSDNDGILDITEAGGVGIDEDNDGRIDNFIDADDKGVDDAIQASALPIFDTDGDGVADFRDSDSDSDGIPDSVEAGPLPTMPLDTDGDGAADFREQDADGDTVPDFAEVGADPANPIDSDGDGVPDFQDSAVSSGAPIADPVSDDVDNDGVPNEIDLDDDNDGLLDSIEGDGDSDFDTTADRFDLDSDNDGVTDLTEAAELEAAELIETVLALDLDNDGRLNASVGENGLADELESTPDSGTSTFTLADSDDDGIPDFQDLDSDNDGIYDAFESGQVMTDINGRLIEASDNNGLVPSASNALRDTDGDGIVDIRDLDSDNDGLVDLLEAGGSDSDGDGRIDEFDDSNGDGADDGLQSVASVVIDTDADGVPDYLDLDSDQDSLSDLLESLGIDEDPDNNGVLDSFDDGNFDGLDDNVAANPALLRDTDQDGMPDQVDLDSDGDGMSDLEEAGGPDIDNDGIVDILADVDNDAIPDIADASATGGEDSDQDGIDDMFDVDFIGGNDTDGDGIADDFDPDNDGNGFVGPAEDIGQGVAPELPDSDGDGVPDVLQADLSAVEGRVETGLDGNGFGCTLSSSSKTNDPLLLMLLIASVASLLWRAADRIKNRLSAKAKSVRRAGLLFAAVSSLALSGCNILIPGGLSEDRGGDSHKGRVYLGAGALVSELQPNADKPDGFSVDETQSAGGSVQLGYDISNRFSLELHGSELGEATFNPRGSVGYQVGGLSALIYGLNDRDQRGLREGFSVFGRLGAGTMRNQGDGVMFERLNDFHALGGLGLEYGFRNGLAVRGEVVAHDTDARFGQLGLLYRFGSAGATKARSPSPRIEVPAQPAVEVEAAPAPAPTVSEPLDAGAPLDLDGDGVLDDVDSCPNSQPGIPVGDTGCALFNGTIEGINFESGSDKLTVSAEQILVGVAGTLNDFPDVRVAVDAHTDNQGSAESNLQLSKRRAIAVARFLVEQGVSGPRLQPRAYGESQPRETNATAAGRARNRRVEFQVVQ